MVWDRRVVKLIGLYLRSEEGHRGRRMCDAGDEVWPELLALSRCWPPKGSD